MSLTRVTITGADDDVAVSDLIDLSREFLFVEWGVLVSPKRWGTARYPSRLWIHELAVAWRRADVPVALSLHLCGAFARGWMAGDDSRIKTDVGAAGFKRYQINGFTTSCASTMAWTPLGVDAVLQVRAEDELQEAARVAAAMPRASLLFDPSGGRGIEPFRWPTPPFGARMGYAGGINAENVEQVLADIGPVDGDFWIDMESGVRTDDRFDLKKVRAVLERAAPFVCAGES